MGLILVAEDERDLHHIIVDYLKRNGHTCLSAYDGVEAVRLLKSQPIDLAILDILMPYLDGFSVCQIARTMGNLPILFLTAKTSEEDKLKGYELGADDYVTKPFSPKVLVAKVNALLRRSATDDTYDRLVVGDLILEPDSRTVVVSGKLINLTYKEFELLHLFMTHKNQVFSRAQLLDRIWGFDFDGSSRTVDTHIKTLRQKLGSEGRYIVTLIRSGYKFEV